MAVEMVIASASGLERDDYNRLATGAATVDGRPEGIGLPHLDHINSHSFREGREERAGRANAVESMLKWSKALPARHLATLPSCLVFEQILVRDEDRESAVSQVLSACRGIHTVYVDAADGKTKRRKK